MVNHPTELVADAFSAEIAGYSVLQIAIGAFAVVAVIGGMRYAYRKALGKA